MARYEVRLHNSPISIDADTDDEARVEAYQAITEDLSLLVVRRMPSEDDLPTVADVQGILASGPEEDT